MEDFRHLPGQTEVIAAVSLSMISVVCIQRCLCLFVVKLETSLHPKGKLPQPPSPGSSLCLSLDSPFHRFLGSLTPPSLSCLNMTPSISPFPAGSIIQSGPHLMVHGSCFFLHFPLVLCPVSFIPLGFASDFLFRPILWVLEIHGLSICVIYETPVPLCRKPSSRFSAKTAYQWPSS